MFVPDSQIVDHEMQELIVYCLNNCVRTNTGQFIADFDGVPFPVFKYKGQLSNGEIKASKNCLALILNAYSGFSGIVIKFVDCAQLEIDLVKEQILEIAMEIIDFHFMFFPQQIFQVVNIDFGDEEQ